MGLGEIAERIQAFARDRIVLPMITPTVPLPPEVAGWRVIVVGASVAYAWHLPLVFPNISTLTAYRFDKSPEIADAIASRADAVVIKECAAYFPDGGVDRDLLELWVDQLQEAKIKPIVATALPVTREHAAQHAGRVDAIWRFNDWLRELARDRHVALLDLERAVRISERDRHLRPDLHNGDGLHLRRRAYREHLDHLLPAAMLKAHELAG